MTFRLLLLKDELLVSLRRLRRSKGFVVAVLLQLTIGIAGIVVVHAVLDAMILRPLPFKSQERLVMLWEENRAQALTHQRVAPDKFRDWVKQMRSLEGAAAYQNSDAILSPAARPQRVRVAEVSTGYFELFRLSPILGRALASSDAGAEAHNAVISETLWRKRFAGDSNVLGSVIALGKDQYVVAGVIPASSFPANADIYVPLPDAWQSRVAHSLFVVGLLRPPYDINDCRRELSLVAQRLQQAYPDTDEGWTGTATSLRDEILGESRLAVELAWLGAFTVLLIACFNVANLMLARFRTRLGELALRAAFGATRGQVVMHFLGESIILGCISAGLALIAASAFLRSLTPALWGETLRNLPPITLDWRVLVFSVVVLVLAITLAGVLPALRVCTFSPMYVLQAESRAVTGKSRFSMMLVAVEVGLSACLLLCAGTAMKSLLLLGKVDPGFRTEGISSAEFTMATGRFNTELSRAEFVAELLASARRDPAVMNAGVTSGMPLSGHSQPFKFVIEGVAAPSHADMSSAEYRAVSPGFLKVMGIPLVQGRFLDERDLRDAPPVLLINNAMVRRYWTGENPLGRRISIDGPRGPWRTIVGVIGDTRESSLDRAPVAEMYFPVSQDTPWTMTLVVRQRTHDSPETVMKRVIGALGSEVVPYNIRTADALLAESKAVPQARGGLLVLCAVVAILLAAIGMYSLLASTVSQKTREIGIQMALGATPYEVGKKFAFEGLAITLAGLGVGTAAGLAIARAISAQLYGIHLVEPSVLVFVIVSTLIVAIATCLIPALRAARIEPAEALRHLG